MESSGWADSITLPGFVFRSTFEGDIEVFHCCRCCLPPLYIIDCQKNLQIHIKKNIFGNQCSSSSTWSYLRDQSNHLLQRCQPHKNYYHFILICIIYFCVRDTHSHFLFYIHLQYWTHLTSDVLDIEKFDFGHIRHWMFWYQHKGSVKYYVVHF